MRIIPTRMGTSFTERAKLTNYINHPHAYGDKLIIQSILTYQTGSSPRVWGQVQL